VCVCVCMCVYVRLRVCVCVCVCVCVRERERESARARAHAFYSSKRTHSITVREHILQELLAVMYESIISVFTTSVFTTSLKRTHSTGATGRHV